MRTILALTLAVLLSGCAQTFAGKAMNTAVIGSGAFDLATTRHAINQGAYESNPLMGQSAWQQALVKSAGIGVVLGGAALLELKGRAGWAHVVRGIAIGLWSAAGAWNLSQVGGR